jgi:hypothetical protein
MASEHELKALADQEWHCAPLGNSGEHVMAGVEAILEGLPVPLPSHWSMLSRREKAVQAVPFVLGAVCIGVQSYAALVASDRRARQSIDR